MSDNPEHLEHRGAHEQMSRPIPEKVQEAPLFDIYPDHVEERKAVQRWADNAMFPAAPLKKDEGPKVYLLSMTSDPLGTIAAVNQMYVGKPVRSLGDVTDDERREHWQRVMKTRLKAPFEFIKFHFMIEGVTRAFTHQMVRQRTATFSQESMRFAVVEDNFTDRVALPPSLADTTGEQAKIRERWKEAGEGASDSQYLDELDRLSDAEKQRGQWDRALKLTQEVYTDLVESGMPAEDARGLMPTNILTRLHYTTDLRALLEHAGNRLCTQAQFEWRLVWARMIEAIRDYNPYNVLPMYDNYFNDLDHRDNTKWQQEEISKLFKPICYQTGKCEFMSPDDRACSIRNRVQANHDIGRTSDQWAEEYDAVEGSPIVSGAGPISVIREEAGKPVFIGSIAPVEWLADPTAARRGGGGHIG